jgi:hypothetical protein
MLSILLDIPSFMNRDYESKDLLLGIRAFSNISFDKIPIPSTKQMMDYKSLDEAVTYINATAFDKFLDVSTNSDEEIALISRELGFLI